MRSCLLACFRVSDTLDHWPHCRINPLQLEPNIRPALARNQLQNLLLMERGNRGTCMGLDACLYRWGCAVVFFFLCSVCLHLLYFFRG